MRRWTVGASLLCAILLPLVMLAGSLSVARAEDNYPSRPVKIVVPSGPGGGMDISARLLASKLSDALGQPFVVENRTGASGRVGAEYVVNSAPDGYTLLVTTASTTSALYSVDPTLDYDPRKALAPIAMIADVPMFAAIPASLPAKTIGEFIAYARQNPGKLNYGSGGVGTITHLLTEMFLQEAGIKMAHIPYSNGDPSRLQALGDGEIQFAFASTGTLFAQSDLARVVATSSPDSWPSLPNVPSLKASGINLEFLAWTALFAPAGTPDDIVRKINAKVNEIVKTEEFAKPIAAAGFRPRGGTPEELRDVMAHEVAEFTDIATKNNIKAE